jgi:2-amino-4-hydroxy-6-hydroxymethyldihydropteridine diphosphokinase
MSETPNPDLVDTDTLPGQLPAIRRAVLSLGSNLGQRFASLQGAIHSLADTPGVVITAVSPVYETAPVGGPSGAGDYLNAVVVVDTTLSAAGLLDRVHAVEAAFGRERSVAGAPRTLDIDIIVLGQRRSDTAELVLPHPRAHERAFVLQPWTDVDPDAELPGQGRVADLLSRLGGEGIQQRPDLQLVQ